MGNALLCMGNIPPAKHIENLPLCSTKLRLFSIYKGKRKRKRTHGARSAEGRITDEEGYTWVRDGRIRRLVRPYLPVMSRISWEMYITSKSKRCVCVCVWVLAAPVLEDG